MNKFIITALLGLVGLIAKAQVTETRAAFIAEKIEVKNGIEVIITQNDTAALKVEVAERTMLQNLKTTKSGSTLKVYLSDIKESTATGAIKVYISQKLFPEIKAENGATVTTGKNWQVKDAKIALATGANINADITVTGTLTVNAASGAGFNGLIKAENIKLSLTGGAFAKIIGSADTASVFCSGGTLHAGKLICQKAEVNAQRASTVSIYATDFVKASTDTSSSITYYGKPEKTETGENSYAVKRYTNRLSLN